MGPQAVGKACGLGSDHPFLSSNAVTAAAWGSACGLRASPVSPLRRSLEESGSWRQEADGGGRDWGGLECQPGKMRRLWR